MRVEEMTTEQELKQRCTPEIIKKMVELAEGFEIKGNTISYFNEFNCSTINIITSWMLFPLLIHRAIEGWNKQSGADSIVIYGDRIESCIKFNLTEYMSDNYQPTTLTHAECAMLDCLLEVLR